MRCEKAEGVSGGCRLIGRIGKCRCALRVSEKEVYILLGHCWAAREENQPNYIALHGAPRGKNRPRPRPYAPRGDFVPRPRFNRVGSPRGSAPTGNCHPEVRSCEGAAQSGPRSRDWVRRCRGLKASCGVPERAGDRRGVRPCGGGGAVGASLVGLGTALSRAQAPERGGGRRGVRPCGGGGAVGASLAGLGGLRRRWEGVIQD
jgi:hypothetical protein